MKHHREPKATHCEQKLEIIRRYNNLPKNCSQLYEIKIVNFKECDEQLKPERHSIKNKLFEIAKELQDLKFQQNLRMKFKKEEEFFIKIIFLNPWFVKKSILVEEVLIFYYRSN